jgi:hypothetical protein
LGASVIKADYLLIFKDKQSGPSIFETLFAIPQTILTGFAHYPVPASRFNQTAPKLILPLRLKYENANIKKGQGQYHHPWLQQEYGGQ